MRDQLTARQAEVLALIAAGYENAEIARRLSLSVRTVEMHRGQGMAAIRAKSRADIVRWILNITGGGRPADSPLMVLVADDAMHFTDASEAACRELGYDHDELLAMRVPEIVLDRETAETLYARFLASGEQHGMIKLRRKEGPPFEAAYSAYIRQLRDRKEHISVLFPE